MSPPPPPLQEKHNKKKGEKENVVLNYLCIKMQENDTGHAGPTRKRRTNSLKCHINVIG